MTYGQSSWTDPVTVADVDMVPDYSGGTATEYRSEPGTVFPFHSNPQSVSDRLPTST